MSRLHIIQAEAGDCLLLEWQDQGKTHFMLIDGGPDRIYEDHLKGALKGLLPKRGRLERLLLSHVDDDHVNGLLDLFGDLVDGEGPAPIKIGGLWHNTFSQVLGREIEERLFRLVETADRSSPGFSPREVEFLLSKDRSIAQGDQLTVLAGRLKVKINPELPPDGLFSVETLPQELELKGLRLRLVGPLQKNLEKLRREWQKWLATREKELKRGITPKALDQSVPNLSSLMFLVKAGDKTLLLTGDGRGDHLLAGLRQAGLLKPRGKLHVDVLKLPHHGSSRNSSLKFFQTVTADRYVISANGKDGNPDLDTLVWIAQAAREAGRKIEILVTNESDSTRQFKAAFDPDVYGYTWTCLPEGAHGMSLDLLAPTGSGAQPVPFEAASSGGGTGVVVTQPGGGSSQPASRRALLVGINEFPNPTWKLRGCVNDALDLKDILLNLYAFREDDIHLVTDREATGQRIRDELAWLLSAYTAASGAGDVRLFAFSSHGTQVADQTGDEWECKDEVIVPYDHSFSNPFRDDELGAIFQAIPPRTNFTFLADCCHSGTIQMRPEQELVDFKPRYLLPPVEIEQEILVKETERDANAHEYATQELLRLLQEDPQKLPGDLQGFYQDLLRRFRENRFGMVKTDRHVLLAACKDKQTAADARIEGAYRGAFTWAFGKTVREAGGRLTYEQAIQQVAQKMSRFTQTPQLECPDELKALGLFRPLEA